MWVFTLSNVTLWAYGCFRWNCPSGLPSYYSRNYDLFTSYFRFLFGLYLHIRIRQCDLKLFWGNSSWLRLNSIIDTLYYVRNRSIECLRTYVSIDFQWQPSIMLIYYVRSDIDTRVSMVYVIRNTYIRTCSNSLNSSDMTKLIIRVR